MRNSKAAEAGGGFVLVCAALLFLCCLALAWKVFSLRAYLDWPARGVSAVGLTQLTSGRLEFSEPPLRIAELGYRYVALTIFTPGDCPPTLKDVGRFDPGGLPVFARIGIMSYASSDEVGQTKSNLNLNFPILADMDGRWLRRLSPPQTPWFVVLDIESRQIVRQGEIPSFRGPSDAAPWPTTADGEELVRR